MSQDYISFEEALKELNLRSAELKKLMSEGQIRGIRDGDSIKFRKDEVEKLAQTKGEQEVTEELLFVDEDGVEEGMATAEISEEDTLLEAEPEVLEEDIQLPAEEEKKETRPARRAKSAPARRPRARREETEETDQEKTWERIALVATAVIMLYGIFAVLAAISGRVDGMTEFLANLFKP